MPFALLATRGAESATTAIGFALVHAVTIKTTTPARLLTTTADRQLTIANFTADTRK